jgi:hypothetical protein
MDMTLAEMDVFLGGEASGKKRNKKILIFKYSNWKRQASGKKEE